MKKALATFVLIASCAFEATAAQTPTSNVRVGPAADETVAGSSEAKKDSANDPKKDTGKKGKADKRKSDSQRAEKGTTDAPAVSSNTSNVAPANPSASPATSDAPPKTGAGQTVPVGPPKSTLTADKTALDSSGNGAKPASNNTGTNSAAAPSSPNTLQPPPAPAPTSIYRVGIGDVLDIRLINTPTRASTLFTVMAGGLIDYPLAGNPLNVAGMTTEEVGVRIAAELRRRAVFDKPQVFVSVREYASHTVLVSGLVYDPGVKVLRREAVPLYVVIAEAQPKPEAGRAIVMSHATGQSTAVELSNPQALNMLIYPSDVVNLVARPQEFFYIGGEVGAPGQKDFHAGMTLTQAILASGGTTRNATGTVRVSRQSADGRLVSTTHNLKLIQEGTIPDPALQSGDRIEVERKK